WHGEPGAPQPGSGRLEEPGQVGGENRRVQPLYHLRPGGGVERQPVQQDVGRVRALPAQPGRAARDRPEPVRSWWRGRDAEGGGDQVVGPAAERRSDRWHGALGDGPPRGGVVAVGGQEGQGLGLGSGDRTGEAPQQPGDVHRSRLRDVQAYGGGDAVAAPQELPDQRTPDEPGSTEDDRVRFYGSA